MSDNERDEAARRAQAAAFLRSYADSRIERESWMTIQSLRGCAEMLDPR